LFLEQITERAGFVKDFVRELVRTNH